MNDLEKVFYRKELKRRGICIIGGADNGVVKVETGGCAENLSSSILESP